MIKRVNKIKNIELAKRRLMFSVAEDSYFLTYNIILILGLLKCVNNKYLKDSSKIALLVTILEKIQNVQVIRKVLDGNSINNFDKKILFDMYYNNKLRCRSVTSMIFSLDKKGIINVKKNGRTIDISLADNNIYIKIINEKIFEDDLKAYEYIFLNVQRIKSIVSDTFAEVIFKPIKEEIWDI